jgi:hypothetical protein
MRLVKKEYIPTQSITLQPFSRTTKKGTMTSHARTKPLQVYLDSSDFSHLSSQASLSMEYQEVERFLIRMQFENRIELRFSQAHVAEASPVRQTDLCVAAQRLSHIKKLCGKKCLMPPSMLMEAEARAAIGSLPLRYSEVYRDNGAWTPFEEEEFNFPSPEEMIRELIKEQFSEHSDRQKIGRKLFDKKGRMKPAAHEILNQNSASALNEFSRKFPLSPAALQVVLRYMIGGETRQNAFAEVQASFADLEIFSLWYEKNWETTIETSAWLRSTGDALKTSLEATSNQLSRSFDAAIAGGMRPEVFWEMGRSTFQNLLSEMLFIIAQRIAQVSSLPSFPDNSQKLRERMPGLFAASTIGLYVARRVAMVPGVRRKARLSDFGDIYHSLYLPYVDIFRCDAFIGSVISEAKLPFSTRIVDRFVDLPLAIEQKLASAQSRS